MTARKKTSEPEPEPTPSAVDIEREAIERLRTSRVARDRHRAALQRAESDVNAAMVARDLALERELESTDTDSDAAEAVAEALERLRTARETREMAHAGAEAAQAFSERALRQRERVQRELAPELGLAMTSELDELAALQGEAVHALRAWHSRRSAVQGRYERLLPGLSESIKRRDGAAGDLRDDNRIRAEATSPDPPINAVDIERLAADTPTPWCLDDNYVPGEPRPFPEAEPAEGMRALAKDDPRYVRHVNPHAQRPGEHKLTPQANPAPLKLLTPEQLMRQEMAILDRF